MVEKQSIRRRQLYVKKEFQFSFILKFCLILLAGVLVSSALLFYFSRGTLTSTFSHSRLVIRSTAEAMLPAIVTTNLISLALILLATIIVTLYISHKIAGPIFRLENELQRIGQGDLSTSVALRNKDQMLAFAQRVNDMTTELNQRVSEIQRQAESIAEASSQPGVPEDVKSRAERLNCYIRENFTL
jgi:methyl-accepting chemotaxis protein